MRGAVPTLLALLLALAPAALADGIANVSFTQTDDARVEVRYVLDGPAGATYRVELLASDDRGGSFSLRPQSVEGDVGRGVEPGPGKVILWDALADVGRLVGDGFVFRVVATRESAAPPERPPRVIIAKPGHSSSTRWVEHEVRQWESLSGIARQYGTTIQAIRRANGLDAHSRIRVGMVLRVPVQDQQREHHGERR